MFDADRAGRGDGKDPLAAEPRVASIEPVRPLRPSGAVYVSPGLGRLFFSRGLHGRPSMWHGEQRMPDSRFALQILCEVEGDRLPGPDHVACVISLRRYQVKDAMACVPLINEELRRHRDLRRVDAEDLVLTLIHLPAHPLSDPLYDLVYRVVTAPELQFTVAFERGNPRAVRLDGAI